ncbi:MAG: LD-carboxypeptidase [Acidobacteria bacterium]|jgi:muramoyltetrapeptide carboxypeptidase|nr:LD-carboxypeptidase [Acidobacteriota bacterium]
MYNRPDPLSAGDGVGIFLPSSPAREPFRSRGLAALRALGFRPREVPDPLAGNDFLSRPPQQTLAELGRFFADPAIKALWAGRGGYGSNYLLPFLDQLRVPAPKIVVASSDASYLLWHLMERCQMVVFYGPMVYGGLAAGEYDREQVLAALTANQEPPVYSGEVLCPGQARGRLTGGCLTNFASLLGTPLLPDVKNRILLLEDVNERPYRLDRLLWQCEQAGVFGRVRALLLGEFPACFKDAGEKSVFYARWRARLAKLGIPVLTDMPFGHAASAQVLPLGVGAEVDADSAPGRLRCEIGVKW